VQVEGVTHTVVKPCVLDDRGGAAEVGREDPVEPACVTPEGDDGAAQVELVVPVVAGEEVPVGLNAGAYLEAEVLVGRAGLKSLGAQLHRRHTGGRSSRGGGSGSRGGLFLRLALFHGVEPLLEKRDLCAKVANFLRGRVRRIVGEGRA